MNQEKLWKALSFVFLFLTLLGAGCILLQKGQMNAGYAVIPCVICILCSRQFTAMQKKKQSKQ